MPGASLHFVLNNRNYEDNRIPPRGFTNAPSLQGTTHSVNWLTKAVVINQGRPIDWIYIGCTYVPSRFRVVPGDSGMPETPVGMAEEIPILSEAERERLGLTNSPPSFPQ